MDKIRRRTGSDYNFDDPDANDTVRWVLFPGFELLKKSSN